MPTGYTAKIQDGESFNDFVLGAQYLVSFSKHLLGWADEMLLYNRVTTSIERTTIYNHNRGIKIDNEILIPKTLGGF